MSDLRSLSVVLATFNGGRFVLDQLVSLSRQTRLPDELLVCDDGSSDNTLAIVNRFARVARFPVRIIRNPVRLGYADNFLHGASLCTGNLIAFCDQDDVWHRSKLQRCVESLESSGALLVIHNASVVDEQLHSLGHAKPSFPCTETLSPHGCELTISLPGFAMVFCANLIDGLDHRQRPVDPMQSSRPQLAHDQWIVFLARSSGKVVYLAETLAWYRQHDRNHCGATQPGRPPGSVLQRATSLAAYHQRSAASTHFAEALSTMAVNDSGGLADRWRASAAEYHDQAKRYAARSLLYDIEQSRIRQVRKYLWLIGCGSYRPKYAGGLGWRALLKDAASLFVRHPALTTPRSPENAHRAL